MQKSGLEVSFGYVSASNAYSLSIILENFTAQLRCVVLKVPQQLVTLVKLLIPLQLERPTNISFSHTGQIVTGISTISEFIAHLWNIFPVTCILVIDGECQSKLIRILSQILFTQHKS